MSYYIRLSRSVANYEGDGQTGVRIRVEVLETNLPSTKLFRYLLEDLNPTTGTQAGVFNGVCSPVDLAEMPEDEPAAVDDPAWFRLEYVDLLLGNRHTVDEFWEDLNEDLDGLISTYTVLDRLTSPEEFTLGTVPDSGSSSSSVAL